MKTKVLNLPTLIALNDMAIRQKANRTMEPKRLAELDKDTIAVVQTHMLHNDQEVRAEIRVSGEPNGVAILDMAIESFNRLPYYEDGKFYFYDGTEIQLEDTNG